MTGITAHRGGADLWPENSLTAFRNAVAMPELDAVELDTRLSSDGTPWVFHDEDLDRLTAASGLFRDKNDRALAEITLSANDEPIPTLDDVLAVVAASPVGLRLEMKREQGDLPADYYVGRVLDSVDRHAMAGRTVIITFDREILVALRQARPSVPMAALYSWRNGMSTEDMLLNVEDAATLGAGMIGLGQRVPDNIGQGPAAHEPLLLRARELELGIGVWTVNGDDAIRAWLDADIDELTTDQPDRALALRGA